MTSQTILRLITTFLFLAATSGLTAAVVDNFNSYSTGDSSDAFYAPGVSHDDPPTGPWFKWDGTAVKASSTVEINAGSGDKLLWFGWDAGDRGAYRDLGGSYEIGDNATGSFEFSFFVKSHDSNNSNNNLYYGIGYDSSPTNGKNSFVAGINLVDNGTGSYLKLSAFNGSDMTAPSGTYNYNTWYHVGLSIDHTNDTYSVYVVEDSGGRTLPASNAAYGAAILTGQSFNTSSSIGSESLSTFMVLADDISSSEHAYLDNVGYSNSIIPEVDNFSLLIGLGLLTACITKRKLSVRP